MGRRVLTVVGCVSFSRYGHAALVRARGGVREREARPMLKEGDAAGGEGAYIYICVCAVLHIGE